MGKGPGKFSDLGKAAADLLSKDFGVGKNTVELKTKAPDAVTLTTNGAHKPGGAADASVQAECKPGKGLTVKGKIDTAGVTSTSFELDGTLMSGLKATLAAATPPLDKSGMVSSVALALDFNTDLVSAACSYDALKGGAAFSGVTALGALKGGVALGYDASKGALKSYAAKAAFTGPTYLLAGGLKGDPKGGLEYGCAYHHAVSRDMEVAAEVLFCPGGKTSIAAASSWALDPETTVKAKVDTSGALALSYKHKLNKATTVVLAGCFDVNLDASKTKTGIALTISP